MYGYNEIIEKVEEIELMPLRDRRGDNLPEYQQNNEDRIMNHYFDQRFREAQRNFIISVLKERKSKFTSRLWNTSCKEHNSKDKNPDDPGNTPGCALPIITPTLSAA